MSGIRAIFFDADQAQAVVARLVSDGYQARAVLERYAGEDDDEDHPWAVESDAPELILEVLVDHFDGWLDVPAAPDTPGRAAAPPPPADLPTGPRRVKRP